MTKSVNHIIEKSIKVKDRINLIRDEETSAIVNNNSAEYSAYLKQRQHRDVLQQKIEKNEKEIISIKKDIKSIKQLLTTIANNLKTNEI